MNEADTRYPIRVVVLGSTGSIGRSALEVISANPHRFKIIALVAGRNSDLLLRQVKQFAPRYAALADEVEAKALLSSVDEHFPGTEFLSGACAINDLAAHPDVDVVLAGIVGMAGLGSVASALRAGKRVALANKESLVAGGRFVSELIAKHGGSIIPVDSEHSAIFQAMVGSERGELSGVTLTASGGPFYKLPASELSKITPEQAVQHPRWNMGAKISVDSATMMNKALEVIEAHWLFGLRAEEIDVVIHPQSIVHSLARFKDGSQIAQLSMPDMKGPIAYALHYPYGRLGAVMEPLDLAKCGALEFVGLDEERFPAVRLAKECLGDASGTKSLVFNVANEIAVDAFLGGKLGFERIVEFVAEALEREFGAGPGTVEEVLEFEGELRSKIRV